MSNYQFVTCVGDHVASQGDLVPRETSMGLPVPPPKHHEAQAELRVGQQLEAIVLAPGQQ